MAKPSDIRSYYTLSNSLTDVLYGTENCQAQRESLETGVNHGEQHLFFKIHQGVGKTNLKHINACMVEGSLCWTGNPKRCL